MPELGLGPNTGRLAISSGGVGSGTLGGGTFGGFTVHQIEIYFIKPYDETEAFYHQAWGFGFFLARGWLWPEEIFAPSTLPLSDDTIVITFYSQDRAVLGRIRSDGQRSILRTLTRTVDEHGPVDMKFELSEWPSFPVIPQALVGLRYGRSRTDDFFGSLSTDAQRGSMMDKYVFEVDGLQRQLEAVSVNNVITVPTGGRDLASIFQEIYDDYIQPRTSIEYNPSKVANECGTPVFSDLDFGKDPAFDVLQSIQDMSGYEWLADEEGDIVFREPPTEVQGVFVVGYGNIVTFDAKRNTEEVFNSIVVQRQQQSGSGQSGWTIAYTANSTESIALYKFREKNQKIPGYFSDDTAVIVGDALLEELKDPPLSGKAKIIILNGGLLRTGLYRFVSEFSEYDVPVTECESVDGFAKLGTGDMTFAVDTAVFNSGESSIRINYTNAYQDVLEYTLEVPEEFGVKQLIFYPRSNRLGSYLRVGVGEDRWNDVTRDFSIVRSNAWPPVIVDIPGQRVHKIGWQILDQSGSAGIVYLDRVSLLLEGNRHFDLRFKRVRDRWVNGIPVSEVELGKPPKGFGEYMQSIFARIKANEFRSEER
jgi:hypothetical protein